jgi:diketogulonate reductase-like aldo/keto reductase
MTVKVPTIDAAGVAMPAIGLGTWDLRGAECTKVVGEAIGLGYRHIDTAAMYGNEREVGEGVRGSGVSRGELFVTTKVWPDNLAPKDLLKSAEASLGRLGLDHVDLFLIHWPSRTVPLAQSIDALCEVKRRGWARAIGVANFTVAMIDEAAARAVEPLACNQVEYHPYLSQARVLEACRRHGMALTAYCPVARGAVSNDPVLREIAAAHGRTPSQVALRWLIQQPGVAAIPKTARRERLIENLAAAEFSLTDAEMARIAGLARPDGRLIDEEGIAPVWDAAE